MNGFINSIPISVWSWLAIISLAPILLVVGAALRGLYHTHRQHRHAGRSIPKHRRRLRAG